MPPRQRRFLLGPEEITLRQLRWLAVLGLVQFVLLLEVARHMLYPYFRTAAGHLAMDGVVVAGALFFFGAVFQLVQRLQTRLERQNQELLALHVAALDIHGDLELESILQRVIDQARQLVDSRYGALAVIDEQRRIQSFVTSGISADHRALIGSPPEGRGVLGIPLLEGESLRLDDIAAHPRSVGFPAHHPPMRSLLAVPILCKGPFRGNLYLADKQGAKGFSASDEETLRRFAGAAALAIDNSFLHERLRALAIAEERVRIAHEMHDGLAQVLAYVNTKTQAAQEFVRGGRREEALAQLEQLAAAARDVYTDVREGIVGLRAARRSERTLVESLSAYVGEWQDRSGIAAELEADGDLTAPPAVEVQIVRIVQEALANVRKHSRATQAHVELRRDGQRVRVRIEDDGQGFDPALLRPGEFPRFGLATMRERAESIGGTLQVQTGLGIGTRIDALLPLTPGVETRERTPHASAHR